MKKLYTIPLLLLLATSMGFAQSFVDINAGLTGISHSHAEWGDYDNDRDLDLLICGETGNNNPVLKLYNNDGGVFTESGFDFLGMTDGSVAWGDYDNDGDLDILATGENSEERTMIYKNVEGSFTGISVNLGYFGPYSFACWGDFDNDGDLDPFLTGQWQSELYVNEGGDQFTPSGLSFMGLSSSRASWTDMDGDGDADLVLTGDTGGGMKLYIYTNEGGQFTENSWGNMGLSAGSVETGDYDSDGDADLLICGYDDFVAPAAEIYRNDGDVFTNIYAGLAPVALGNAAWGDFDNDGDLDVALTGKLAGCGAFATEIYENLGSDVFNSINAGLTAAEHSHLTWVDYDNDTDLDLMLSGNDYYGYGFTKIYRNDVSLPNFLPEAPENLDVIVSEEEVILTWDEGQDIQTPQAGLTYNLRIGSEPGGSDIRSPMAHMSDGYRKINEPGNASFSNQWTLKDLVPGNTYYWSVQTVDNTYAASEFSEEFVFTYLTTHTEENLAGQQEISVYPNPVKDVITINNTGDNSVYTMEIVNTSGTKILSEKIKSGQKINLDGINSGIYIISIGNEANKFVDKLIIR